MQTKNLIPLRCYLNTTLTQTDFLKISSQGLHRILNSLGLSLAYDIVKAHGGEINVESFEGENTNFTITLPM